MALGKAVRESNGHAGTLAGSLSGWRHPGRDEDRHLARLTERQLRRAPGVPGSWPRFLVAHAAWILTVVFVAAGAAAALVHSQTPLYRSQAVVNVQTPAAAASSGIAPNMATEEGIVSSGAVLTRASLLLNVPVATLASGLSVHVPGTTTLLQITYSDPDPRVAQQRAQAIARAYVSYRSSPPAVAHGKTTPNSATPSVTPTAVLVTPAPLPASPASQHRLIDISAALIVGLALGIGTAALRDYLDDRLRGPFDLAAEAGAPVLGLIPAFRPARRKAGGRLVMVADPGSVVAEAYRGLRTRLVQAAASRDARTVLVTSPGWEDKSTVAANLAATLAQSGRRVTLVCADLRWGRAHELFGRSDGDGLSGLLQGRASLETALQPTKVPGLRLLPPGVTPPDPAALLEQPAWRTALSGILDDADTVVIEAPPVLASADTGPLADLADIILIVADARHTTRAQVRAARAQLRIAMREPQHPPGKLAGCVLDNIGRHRRLRSRQPEPPAGHDALARPWQPAATPDGHKTTGPPGHGADATGHTAVGQDPASANRNHPAASTRAPRHEGQPTPAGPAQAQTPSADPEREVPHPEAPQPSGGLEERLFRAMLVVVIVAALIGSILVMLLRSGLLP
jgi:polysaccharide biosynthesis transport protein